MSHECQFTQRHGEFTLFQVEGKTTFITFPRCSSCWSCVALCTIISSEILCTPSDVLQCLLDNCWYFSGTDNNLNINLLYRYRPLCLMNVVILHYSPHNSIWWYPHLDSSTLDTELWFISRSTSSIVEMRYCSRCTA